MKITTFENLLLIYSTVLGIFMLYYVFYIQNIVIKIILICLIELYILFMGWHEDRRR